ncbi:MAG TPA: hypothetical protein VGC14_02720 [Rhizobium sp.]
MAGPPNLTYSQVPTAGQWNLYFSQKQDALGYTPVNRAGDTMTGKLKVLSSSTSAAGINLAPGTGPTSPDDGDLWTTNTGLYVQIDGDTIGPIRNGNMSGPEVSVANNITAFADITGAIVKDSGVAIGSLVQTTRQIVTSAGLTGGGSLSNDVTVGLDSASVASLAKADTSMQPSVYDPDSVGEEVAFKSLTATADQGAKADSALQPVGDTNQLPRAAGANSYNWVSVLYKAEQGGQLDIGTTFSIMGHTGPDNKLDAANPDLWANRNTDPPQAGVNGFTDSGISSYQNVGSVAFYNDIAAPPPIATVSGSFTAGAFIPDTALTAAQLARVKNGLYVLVPASNFWGKITGAAASIITVSGWYQNGNSASGQVPSGTQTAVIGAVTKVWASNINVLAGPDSYADQGLAAEIGVGNYKADYDLATSTGTNLGGLNIASIGPKNTHWALLVSRQAGDGSFARGAYISGCSYASYTAGRWTASDTLTPTYGYLYNYAGGKAFTVGGVAPGETGLEKYYVRGSDGAVYVSSLAGIGMEPLANNRLAIQAGGSAGATNGLLIRNSAAVTVASINDQGLGYLAGGLSSAGNIVPTAAATYALGTSSAMFSQTYSRYFRPGNVAGGPIWSAGAGSPEGVLAAAIGSIWGRTDGAAGTVFYVKETGTGNTGWIAK